MLVIALQTLDELSQQTALVTGQQAPSVSHGPDSYIQSIRTTTPGNSPVVIAVSVLLASTSR